MQKFEIVGTGQTGLIAAGTAAKEVDSPQQGVAFHFAVSAVGATPTITYRWQGSLDGSVWKDLAYITDASDTIAVAARTMTAVGDEFLFLANPLARIYRYFRLIVSANTNVTFGPANIYTPD